jgi:hypothetical protein
MPKHAVRLLLLAVPHCALLCSHTVLLLLAVPLCSLLCTQSSDACGCVFQRVAAHRFGCCVTDSRRRPRGTQSHNYLGVWTVKDTDFQCSEHDVLERKGTQNGEAISVSARLDVTELQSISPLRPSGYYTDHSDCIHTSVRRFPRTQLTDPFL